MMFPKGCEGEAIKQVLTFSNLISKELVQGQKQLNYYRCQEKGVRVPVAFGSWQHECSRSATQVRRADLSFVVF